MLRFLTILRNHDHGNISEGEEDPEEENNTSGVTEVWTNLNPAEQSPTQTNNTPRRNPPRNHKTNILRQEEMW